MESNITVQQYTKKKEKEKEKSEKWCDKPRSLNIRVFFMQQPDTCA